MPRTTEVEMASKSPRVLFACIAVASAVVLALVPAAFAGNGKPAAGTSLVLVPLNAPDGLPHYGKQVTFNVSTAATTEPHVSLKCYQSAVLVYTTQTGYYAGYLWPWTQVMTLSSVAWTGGAAECTAVLYYFKGKSTLTLATLKFHVYA